MTNANADAVTPSDTVNLAGASTGGLWVGGAGNVTVTMLGGQQITFTAVAAGTLLPVAVTRVWATGTSATLIIALRQ